MTPAPNPCRGSLTHPLQAPRPKDPPPPSTRPASLRGPQVLRLSSPSLVGALTGLALLPPGAGRRRGRCGAATSLQLVRWGRRRSGHGVGDPGQRRRGTDAPKGRIIAGKGSRGHHKPPRCGHPECGEGQAPSPSAKCAIAPASPLALPPAAAATGTGTRLGCHHRDGGGGRGLAETLPGPLEGRTTARPRRGPCLTGPRRGPAPPGRRRQPPPRRTVPSRTEGRACARPEAGIAGPLEIAVPSARANLAPRTVVPQAPPCRTLPAHLGHTPPVVARGRLLEPGPSEASWFPPRRAHGEQ